MNENQIVAAGKMRALLTILVVADALAGWRWWWGCRCDRATTSTHGIRLPFEKVLTGSRLVDKHRNALKEERKIEWK